MLLWAGIFLLIAGVLCFAIDRRAVHFFHDSVNRVWTLRIHRTTDWAKGAHWLTIAIAAWLIAWIWQHFFGANLFLRQMARVALAFLASLAIGSIILHTLKLFLGRRRPRDELELGLYGFMPLRFDFQYDSFPSGHALTIFCVAVIACGVLPDFAVLWFAIAAYLACTRALLTAHFPSDVFVGAGVSLIATRETLLYLFPDLMRSWF